jgi:AraC-like DNA-binding protein
MATLQHQPNNKGVLQNTTMATWAGAIARALRVYGVDDRRLFADADIDHALVNNPAQRIPVADMTRLWNLAVAESGDPAFGLAVARQVNLTTFHALGVAAMASATVHEAGDLICKFASMISDGIAMQFHQQGDEVGLVLGMRPDYPRFADASVEAVLASVYLSAKQLVPESGAEHITFQHPCRSDPASYQQFFQCPVSFSAAQDGIYGALDGLASAKLPSSSPQLARANAALCEDYLSERQNLISARVRDLIAKELEQGASPALPAIASTLAMSERKLQRLLREEGIQFRDLLDDVRAVLAKQLLANDSLSIGRIAEQLGFDSLSSFTRACRRWHGVTPRALRQS